MDTITNTTQAVTLGFNLTQSAQALLAQVQQLFGADNVVVTSGRSSRVGVAGGSATSQHPSGNAFDFHVTGFTPAQVQTALASSPIPFGQSIQEYGAAAGNGLNHLGVGTKRQLLTGNDGKYKTTGYAAQVAATAQANVNATVGDWLKQFGLGGISNSLGETLAAPGDAIDGAIASVTPDWNTWFTRITLGVFAVLIIALALFMLSKSTVSDVVGKLSPV